LEEAKRKEEKARKLVEDRLVIVDLSIAFSSPESLKSERKLSNGWKKPKEKKRKRENLWKIAS